MKEATFMPMLGTRGGLIAVVDFQLGPHRGHA